MSVAIHAVFTKATTTADHGWNVTFATHMAEEVTEIAKMREEALYIVVLTEAEYFASQNNRQE